MSFDYTISIPSTWPPSGRPNPPYGPTAVDVLLVCPLRSCFDFSSGYERRMGVAARIGTAMHKTIQSLNENPIQSETLETISSETRRRFYAELDEQKKQASDRPREVHLLWDQPRIDRALEAVIAEAIRISGNHSAHSIDSSTSSSVTTQPGFFTPTTERLQGPIELPANEIPVQSRDNLFRGRIDRAEQTPEGTRLVDYKSAYRDDLPERYTRQVQFYAYLWSEVTGEWPTEGQVFYPLKGTFYQVSVDQDKCRQVVAESVAAIEKLKNYKNLHEMARPGNACKVCDYRPWCQPFWDWQASEKILTKAKENSSIGFEGKLENISLTDHYWRLLLEWKGIKIRLVIPQERFTHLAMAQSGQTLRLLDAPLKGALNQPTVQVYDTTEIFLLL